MGWANPFLIFVVRFFGFVFRLGFRVWFWVVCRIRIRVRVRVGVFFFSHDFLILSIKVFSLFSILFFYPSFPSPFHFPCSIISFCSSWLPWSPCFSLHLQNKREKRKSKFKKKERIHRNGRTSLIFSFSSFFSGFFHFLVLSNLLSPSLLLIYSSFSWRWREKRLGILGAQPYSDMWTWRQRLELSLQFTWHQYVSITTWSHQVSMESWAKAGLEPKTAARIQLSAAPPRVLSCPKSELT